MGTSSGLTIDWAGYGWSASW